MVPLEQTTIIVNLKSQQDGDFDASDLQMVLTKKLLKDEGTFRVFNIAKNSGELEDGECDDLEECANLDGNEDYKTIEIALINKYTPLDIGSFYFRQFSFNQDHLARVRANKNSHKESMLCRHKSL